MILKRIVPAAIVTLKEALANVYWYKADLRSFLSNTLSDPRILSRLDWSDYKRNIVHSLVDYLSRNQNEFQADLLRLMTEVARIDNFSHLARLENGKEKATNAKESIQALQKFTVAHEALYTTEKEKEEKRRTTHKALLKRTAIQELLNELTQEYYQLLGAENPQRRGYRLDKDTPKAF